jgi:cyclic beta-1,2-glucan synthetase
VYQDLFGEGSYTGKGIYDIDAFELALAGRAPDSSLLSHDLFEGVFARAGLASDIEVVEEFPARYDVAAVRAHRWARGDWQLLPWIVGCGPNVAAGHRPAAVPTIGRWKMLDNLRRTMSAPAAVATLLVGLVLPIKAAIVWVAFAILTIVLPVIVPVIGALIPSRGGTTMRSHVRALGMDIGLALAQSGLVVVFLAHQAWLMTDAILRTLGRLLFTRRHLLEWVPAAQSAMSARPSLSSYYRRMAGAVAIGILVLAVGLLAKQGAWPMACVLAAL